MVALDEATIDWSRLTIGGKRSSTPPASQILATRRCWLPPVEFLRRKRKARATTGYRGAQNFRTFQAEGGAEKEHPIVMGRLDWQKARFGACPFSRLIRKMSAWWTT